MATDGVKIIDGDTAHDVYSGIMDLYDAGATIDNIKSKIPFPEPGDYDDFEHEVYITAYALAMWEIGHLTEDVLKEVRLVIDKGAGVKVWTEEADEKTGKQRQKELDKFWNKISSPNAKIRKRKKYKSVKNFLLEENEVLAFQLEDKNYYSIILLDINQYRSQCTYMFGKIRYKSINIPTLSQILDSEIIGRKIPSGHDMDAMKIFMSLGHDEIVKQGGIQSILEREAERTGSYIIGLSKTGIEHKDLINILDKFTRIGKINLSEKVKVTGPYGVTDTFEGLTRDFTDLDSRLKAFNECLFKIRDFLEE